MPPPPSVTGDHIILTGGRNRNFNGAAAKHFTTPAWHPELVVIYIFTSLNTQISRACILF